eukprot:3654694-Prymnesium_polylepis.1
MTEDGQFSRVQSSLKDLPSDLVNNIAARLDAHALASLSGTSKDARSIAREVAMRAVRERRPELTEDESDTPLGWVGALAELQDAGNRLAAVG